MAPRITIKSIAQDLGVSHMTVSRALSGHTNVREDVRAAIIKHAATLGYIKSAAATAMRGDATRIVGLLLPNIINEFYAGFANALALHCADHAFNMMIYLTNDDAKREKQSLLRLQEMQATTVVMVPAPQEENASLQIPESMNIIQLIRTSSHYPKSGALLIEDSVPIRDAVLYLASKGHSHIGFIGSHESLSSGRTRLAAYQGAIEEAGLKIDKHIIRTDTPSFEMGAKNALSIRKNSGATALICGGFEISNGALDACLRHGLLLPQDLAFVGYGDPSFYEWIAGGITTIALPFDALAKQAADMIISANGTVDHIVKLPAKLMIRHTT